MNCIGPKDCMKYVLNKAAASETLCRVFHFVAFPTLTHCKWSVYLVSVNSWLTGALSFCPCTVFIIQVSNCATQVLLAASTCPHLSAPPCRRLWDAQNPQSWIQSLLQQNITTKDELECQSFWILTGPGTRRVWRDNFQQHRCFYQLMKYLQNQTIPVCRRPGGSYFISPGTVQYSGPHSPNFSIFQISWDTLYYFTLYLI